MKKYLIIIALFILVFGKSIEAFAEHKHDVEDRISTQTALDNREYLCYEFGISKIVSVYIVEGETICDVLIDDGDGHQISTTCEKTPILKWAFENMAIDLKNEPEAKDNVYNPFFYRLSLIKDGCTAISTSSMSETEYNHDVNAKLQELKEFIVNIWYGKYIKKTS